MFLALMVNPRKPWEANSLSRLQLKVAHHFIEKMCPWWRQQFEPPATIPEQPTTPKTLLLSIHISLRRCGLSMGRAGDATIIYMHHISIGLSGHPTRKSIIFAFGRLPRTPSPVLCS